MRSWPGASCCNKKTEALGFGFFMGDTLGPPALSHLGLARPLACKGHPMQKCGRDQGIVRQAL